MTLSARLVRSRVQTGTDGLNHSSGCAGHPGGRFLDMVVVALGICSFFLHFLATLCSMRNLSSLTRDWIHVPCSASVES